MDTNNRYSVLLVDDEEDVIQIIVKKLDWEAMGLKIIGHAANGVEALELAEELQPDILDPIASVAICVLIVKASVDIFRDAIDKMVDHSCDEATEESMREVIMGVKGVKGIDLLQTRLFGSKMYVDIEISADGEIPLNEAHDVAENVHHTIEKNFKDVKHCMVHVNPVNE